MRSAHGFQRSPSERGSFCFKVRTGANRSPRFSSHQQPRNVATSRSSSWLLFPPLPRWRVWKRSDVLWHAMNTCLPWSCGCRFGSNPRKFFLREDLFVFHNGYSSEWRTLDLEECSMSHPFKLSGTGRYANVRTDFSRSHCRFLAAATNASSLWISTTPESSPTFAIFKRVWPPLSTAIALR